MSGSEEKGLAQGRAEGLVEGQQAERLAIAKQLKDKGRLTVQEIVEMTGLSSTEIGAL